MRLLTRKSSIAVFRYDVVYLHAGLLADLRPEVNGIAQGIGAHIAAIKAERDLLEQAEDAFVIAVALKSGRARNLYTQMVKMGGVARALNKDLYGVLFPKLGPSQTGKLPVDKQIIESERIAGELAALPNDHPLRVEYEQALLASIKALRDASKGNDAAAVALALARSRMDQLKAELDKARLEAHGKLLQILKSRSEADQFFRSVTTAPGEKAEGKKAGEAEEVVAAPVAGQSAPAPAAPAP